VRSTGEVSEPRHVTAPIRSMTGFALARGQTSAGELTISLRSVNHRGLDLHFHQPGELAVFENGIRGFLKHKLARGHVEVRMSLKRDPGSEAESYNQALLSHYLGSFNRACLDFGLECKPDLNALFAIPGVFNGIREAKPFDEGFEQELMSTLVACTDELNAYREREGQALYSGLKPELAKIAESTQKIEGLRLEARSHFHESLRERLRALAGEAGISESRLAEEAAVLADRSDLEEELIRLKVHTEELRRTFSTGGEIGKRLDFLLQEMNRETNTILSKTSGAGDAELAITNLALGIKANIEKIREQALNLE